MYTPLTEEQFNKAIVAGYKPEQIIEMEKQRKAKESSPSVWGKVGNVASKVLSPANPVLGALSQTKAGKKIALGALEFGKKSLGEALVPAVTPFAMVANKDIKIPGTDSIARGSPTPGQALGAGISAGLWAVPVEKVFAPVLKPVGKFLGGVAERFAGAVTGKGTTAITEILKNPKAALQGLRGEEIKILTENATQARNAVINLDRAHVADYAKALEELPKRLGKLPQVLSDNLKTTIKVEGKTYVLSKQGIKSAITNVLKDANVIVSRKNNFLDFTQSPLTDVDGAQIKKVWNLINDWVDTSPKGLNELSVKLGKFKRNAPGNEFFNTLIGKIKNSPRDYMGDIIPAVKEMNANYATQASTIEKLREILDVPNNLKTPEGLIDIAKKMQNFFTGNKQLEQALFKEAIPGGQEMVSKEAGRLVAQAPSRASASIGDTFKNLFQTVISPKMVGEIVAKTGIAAEKIEPILNLMKDLAPAEREILFNLFKGSTEANGQSTIVP